MEGKAKRNHVRDEETLDILAKRLVELRKKAGLSQRQLAFEAGLTDAQIANIEKAKGNPTISILAKIARVLEVSLSELLRAPEEERE